MESFLNGTYALGFTFSLIHLTISLVDVPGVNTSQMPAALSAGMSSSGMTPPQKILLAPQADRLTRVLLVQDSDPQVLYALLKNPRLTLDEVLRVAKSTYLSFQSCELILKTAAWFSNLDIRVALIQNPKTPLPFALRILPTLPDNEVRAIAKGAATSMALKQAALKRLHGGG